MRIERLPRSLATADFDDHPLFPDALHDRVPTRANAQRLMAAPNLIDLDVHWYLHANTVRYRPIVWMSSEVHRQGKKRGPLLADHPSGTRRAPRSLGGWERDGRGRVTVPDASSEPCRLPSYPVTLSVSTRSAPSSVVFRFLEHPGHEPSSADQQQGDQRSPPSSQPVDAGAPAHLPASASRFAFIASAYRWRCSGVAPGTYSNRNGPTVSRLLSFGLCST